MHSAACRLVVVPPRSAFSPRTTERIVKPATPLVWTWREVAGLSRHTCRECHGGGLLHHRGGRWYTSAPKPCDCVCREIFRECLRKRLQVLGSADYSATVAAANPGAVRRSVNWGWKNSEFMADLELSARRVLIPADYQIFRAYHLAAREARHISTELHMAQGTIFHRIYALEATLGRVWRELGLYPTDQYFGGSSRRLRKALLMWRAAAA